MQGATRGVTARLATRSWLWLLLRALVRSRARVLIVLGVAGHLLRWYLRHVALISVQYTATKHMDAVVARCPTLQQGTVY